MSSVADITGVFATLASYLQTQNPREDEEKSLNRAVSKLNGSLNLNDGAGGGDDDPAVQFLNTALSLMCFTAPQVFDSVIERLVKTIAAALSSSVSCKVVKFANAEALLIGSSILERDRVELIEACSDVLVKLNDNGMHSHMLLDAVVRVTFSASCCQYSFPAYPVKDANPARCRSSAALALLNHLPRDFCLNNDEVPLRLLLWYLDPLVLKHDVSEILRETMERPFLCLDHEFRKRTDWRMIVICLVLCPIMLIETRALLHKWFLETGAAPLLEFLIKLVAVMLDVSSRPTYWDISTEMGLKLPFSGAYFPFRHCFFRILAGPLSSTSFVDLVQSTCNDSARKPRTMKIAMIDHKSACRAFAINFPTWYYYASVSLFYGQAFDSMSQNTKTTHGMEPLPCSTSAASYISWVLDPINEIQRAHLVDCLIKSSESWIHGQSASGGTDQETAVTASRKKLKKPKFCDSMQDHSLRESLQNTVSWLEKFNNVCETCWPLTLGPGKPQTLMFRCIPLGILVGWPGDINGDRCELLLYYAATGRISQSKQTGSVGPRNSRKGCQGVQESAVWIDECNIEDAVTGACLVFRLTDIVESLSGSLFETEENRISFVCRFKGRAYGFLVKCIKRLMSDLGTIGDGPKMISDLHFRLMRWKNQGQELVNVRKDLDDIIVRLNSKMSAT
ncbi:uncharacterized protein LOC116202044 isoform X1 [Punica granatum]|uniref:Uncharacterized protein LOC116202044 isoform X1 n=1 Tax=Punica granatum TaxID=22663 RepID=A0A6P8DDM7_PUNGR|nr:uncharacterized protein LOC116202044 isoform X1 [Punica granatum]